MSALRLRLNKAPRRQRQTGGGTLRFEALESRQMLSADGLDLTLFADPAPAAAVPAEMAGDGDPAAMPMIALSDTFRLNSNPTAEHTIYLDFNGHLTDNVYWDNALIGMENLPPGRFGLPFITPAYDSDGDRTSFSDEELMVIQETFFRVAEDFAPFEVNVTTVEPPVSDLINDGPGDTRWGVRIAVGGSTYDWLTRTADPAGQPAGGVALLNSFASDLDTPAYAFTEEGNISAQNIAEIVSHEAGHTLGLIHDGQFIDPLNIPIDDPAMPPTEPEFDEYYGGHANGLWGSIMGAAYNQATSQWSQGEYLFARNDGFGPTDSPLQDDLAVITGANGFGYRADDFGDTLADAIALEADYDTSGYSISGLIEQNTDFDWFSFEADPGMISISALPAAVGANLDIRLEVFDEAGNLVEATDAAGNVVTTIDSFGNQTYTTAPDYDLTAGLSFLNLLPGRFFVSVTGDDFADNFQEAIFFTEGYSDYGSLGEYHLSVNAPLGNPPDRFESNNTELDATILPPGDYSFTNLSLHEDGDQDWFLWEAPANGELKVDALFQHSLGDVELQVFTEGGALLAKRITSTNNESATVPVTAGDRYYIQIYGAGGGMQENYSLQIASDGLAADQFELNNSSETATNLGSLDADEQASLHYDGDVDWYEWLAPAEGTLSVETRYDQNEVELTVEVYDSNDQLVATSYETSSGNLVNTEIVLQLDNPESGLFRIKVFSEATDPEKRLGEYRFILDGTGTAADAFEPNNSLSMAIEIDSPNDRFYGLSISTSSDHDYFRFTPEENGIFRADLRHLYDFGDLDMRLIDSTGRLINLASSRNDDEAMVSRLLGGQTYFIDVFGYEGSTHAAYTLETTFTPTPPVVGDYNGDNFVGLRDRMAWLEDYGKTGPDLPSDGNGDGVVNAADYTIYRDNLGGGFEIDGGHHHDHNIPPAPVTTAEDAAEVAAPVTPTRARVAFTPALRDLDVDKPVIAPLGFFTTTVERSVTSTPAAAVRAESDDSHEQALLLALGDDVAVDNDQPGFTDDRRDEAREEEKLVELDNAFAMSI